MKVILMVFMVIVLSATSAFATEETVSYAISEDGSTWITANVTLDSESWIKTYVNGMPIWIEGSEITETERAEMDADAASEPYPSSSLYSTEGICECWQNSKKVAICPCTGSCKYNGTPATCTGRVVE